MPDSLKVTSVKTSSRTEGVKPGHGKTPDSTTVYLKRANGHYQTHSLGSTDSSGYRDITFWVNVNFFPDLAMVGWVFLAGHELQGFRVA